MTEKDKCLRDREGNPVQVQFPSIQAVIEEEHTRMLIRKIREDEELFLSTNQKEKHRDICKDVPILNVDAKRKDYGEATTILLHPGIDIIEIQRYLDKFHNP